MQDAVVGWGAGTTKNNPKFCLDLPFWIPLSSPVFFPLNFLGFFILFIPAECGCVAFLGAQLRQVMYRGRLRCCSFSFSISSRRKIRRYRTGATLLTFSVCEAAVSHSERIQDSGQGRGTNPKENEDQGGYKWVLNPNLNFICKAAVSHSSLQCGSRILFKGVGPNLKRGKTKGDTGGFRLIRIWKIRIPCKLKSYGIQMLISHVFIYTLDTKFGLFEEFLLFFLFWN